APGRGPPPPDARGAAGGERPGVRVPVERARRGAVPSPPLYCTRAARGPRAERARGSAPHLHQHLRLPARARGAGAPPAARRPPARGNRFPHPRALDDRPPPRPLPRRGGASPPAASSGRAQRRGGRDAKRRDAALALALFALALALQLPIALRWLNYTDEGRVLQAAAEIDRGKVLYRDVIMPDPGPGVFYLLAGLLRATGPSFTAARLAIAVLSSAMAALLYLIARGAMPRGPALLAGLGFVPLRMLAFPVWHGFYYASCGAFLVTLAFAILLVGLRRARPGLVAVAGALGGLGFVTRQDLGTTSLLAMLIATALVAERPGRRASVVGLAGDGRRLAPPAGDGGGRAPAAWRAARRAPRRGRARGLQSAARLVPSRRDLLPGPAPRRAGRRPHARTDAPSGARPRNGVRARRPRRDRPRAPRPPPPIRHARADARRHRVARRSRRATARRPARVRRRAAPARGPAAGLPVLPDSPVPRRAPGGDEHLLHLARASPGRYRRAPRRGARGCAAAPRRLQPDAARDPAPAPARQ